MREEHEAWVMRTISLKLSDEAILKKLELIRDKKSTRVALFLFGKDPEKYFESAFFKTGRFRSSTTILDYRELHRFLISRLEEAEA